MEFAEFYESARDDGLWIAPLNVGDRQLAEDLVAEGFTKAWMSWRKVRDLQAPHAWVVRTALNANISRWRRHRREVALDDHDIAMPADQGAAISGELLAASAGCRCVSVRWSRCGCCWTWTPRLRPGSSASRPGPGCPPPPGSRNAAVRDRASR